VNSSKDILRSDEAIVAVIGHEMYELEEMRKAFGENGAPSNTGWLKLILTMRAIFTGKHGIMQTPWWPK
jgi:hypothetical protein